MEEPSPLPPVRRADRGVSANPACPAGLEGAKGAGPGPCTLTPWGQHQGPRKPSGSGPGPEAGCGEEGLTRPAESGLFPPGFSSPCTFVVAVSGANGSVLWERPAAQDGALVQCAVPQPRGSRASSACVLAGRPGSFVAVDSFTGRWLHTPGPPPGSSQEVQPVFLGPGHRVRRKVPGEGGSLRGMPPPSSHALLP